MTTLKSFKGRGSFNAGPKATGSSGGSVSKQIQASFSVQASVSLDAPANVVKGSFGVTVGQSISQTSTCLAIVNPGQTIQIYYRGLYQAYKGTQILYQTGPGIPTKELSRKEVTIYKPVDIEFKW